MTNADYVLKRFEENDTYKFWDVKTAGGRVVESMDNEDVTHAEATNRLSELFQNLEGAYTVIFRTKTKKSVAGGGDARPAAEFTVRLGNPQSMQGIGNINGGSNYIDKYIQETQLRSAEALQYKLAMFEMQQTINELKRNKKEDTGIGSNMENVLVAIACKELGIQLPGVQPIAGPVINGIVPQNENEAEQRVVAALEKMQHLNPGGNTVVMLENLATLMQRFPDKIPALNQSLQNVADGGDLLPSFMPLAT